MTLDDETRQKLGALFADKRNSCAREVESIDEFLNWLGTPFRESPAVEEETFSCLKFEKQTGNRIGEFEVANKVHNISETFQRAYNILEKNNATISNRYSGEGYGFSYWLYGSDKIYRQAQKSQS